MTPTFLPLRLRMVDALVWAVLIAVFVPAIVWPLANSPSSGPSGRDRIGVPPP